MRRDLVATYKIKVENLKRFDRHYLAEDAKMIKGVIDAEIVDLRDTNAFVLNVRFHRLVDKLIVEDVAQRIFSMLERDSSLLEVSYGGLLAG